MWQCSQRRREVSWGGTELRFGLFGWVPRFCPAPSTTLGKRLSCSVPQLPAARASAIRATRILKSFHPHFTHNRAYNFWWSQYMYLNGQRALPFMWKLFLYSISAEQLVQQAPRHSCRTHNNTFHSSNKTTGAIISLNSGVKLVVSQVCKNSYSKLHTSLYQQDHKTKLYNPSEGHGSATSSEDKTINSPLRPPFLWLWQLWLDLSKLGLWQSLYNVFLISPLDPSPNSP